MIRTLFRPIRNGRRSPYFSLRLKLDDWPKARVFPLRVTDRRVAEEKRRQIILEHEREAAGLLLPRACREGLQRPLADHLAAYLIDLEAKGRAKLTLRRYRRTLSKLFARCGWRVLRDVTAGSFSTWRGKEGRKLAPKFVNDLLGNMRGFLRWLERGGVIPADPLRHVDKVADHTAGTFRRAATEDELGRLLAVASPQRAAVYRVAYYTGLRRGELNAIRWSDIILDDGPARIAVPAAVTKNRKVAVIALHPDAVAALDLLRDEYTQPVEWAFHGKVPSVPMLRRDLAAAGIPFLDARGRRLDVHSLRHTLGTHLAKQGVAPQVAKEIMRHSDIRLTMRIYTDAGQLPLAAGVAQLPSFPVSVARRDDTQRSTQTDAQTGVHAGVSGSSPVATPVALAFA